MQRESRFMFVFIVTCSIMLAAAAAPAEEAYPLRAKFPDVKYISTKDLNNGYQKIVIVDVRSKTEFDVIHINKAFNVQITTSLFTKEIEKIREKAGAVPIAFYCNGHTCAKSYEAVEEAKKAGFENIYAYDAGIHDWARTHPEKTTLMGKTPAQVEKMISKEMLAKRKISFAEFKKKAEAPDAMIIDSREPFQRKAIPQLPGTLRNVPTDRLVQLIKEGQFKGNQLLIMDAVGKQVEWIQYYLEAGGYKNYYFLEKGVTSAVEAGAVQQVSTAQP
jgi:rhodanese-related sulfurtransferase